jgi:hypothetical protein
MKGGKVLFPGIANKSLQSNSSKILFSVFSFPLSMFLISFKKLIKEKKRKTKIKARGSSYFYLQVFLSFTLYVTNK